MSVTDGNLFLFLSQGKKLYIQQAHSVFCEKRLKGITVVKAHDLDTIKNQKFDLVILSHPFDESVAIKGMQLASRNGQIIFCAQNDNMMRRIAWLFRIVMLKRLCKTKSVSQNGLYYVSPGFDFAVQLVSNHRFVSQQYFKQHYHWRFTGTQPILKRTIKHFVYKMNAFYLLERSVILGSQKC